MPRRAAKQCVPRNEDRLNNIAGPVSTPVLNFLRLAGDVGKFCFKTVCYAASADRFLAFAARFLRDRTVCRSTYPPEIRA